MVHTKWELVCNPLSCVYFGNLVTEIHHFILLKGNKSAQLRTNLMKHILEEFNTLLQSIILTPHTDTYFNDTLPEQCQTGTIKVSDMNTLVDSL